MTKKLSQDDTKFVELTKHLFRRRTIFEFLFGISIFVLVILFVFGGSITNTLFAVALVIYFVIALPLSVFNLAHVNSLIDKKVWQYFQESYGITSDKLDKSPVQGVMNEIDGRKISTVLFTGEYKNYCIRVINYTVNYYRSDRLAYIRHYRILEITTNQNFINVFMDSHANNRKIKRDAMTLLSDSVAHNKKLIVEGDMHNYFTIYIPNETLIDSLVTLTPDKLIALRDYGKNFDVEFIGNKINVITDQKIKNVQDILAFQASIIVLLDNIGAELIRNYKFDDNRLSVKHPSAIDMLKNIK